MTHQQHINQSQIEYVEMGVQLREDPHPLGDLWEGARSEIATPQSVSRLIKDKRLVSFSLNSTYHTGDSLEIGGLSVVLVVGGLQLHATSRVASATNGSDSPSRSV